MDSVTLQHIENLLGAAAHMLVEALPPNDFEGSDLFDSIDAAYSQAYRLRVIRTPILSLPQLHLNTQIKEGIIGMLRHRTP